MRRRSALVAWAMLAVGLALAPGGCAERPSHDVQAERCPEGVVDEVLLAFLSKARAAHHRADLFELDKELDGAIEEIERLVTGVRPGGGTPPPEVREVLSDSFARLAELRGRLGRFDEAERDLDEGLGFAPEVTHFRGRLFEVRGVVEKERAAALEKDGKLSESKAARERAIRALQQAIDVQEQVIREALGAQP
ncbi:MAG: hypothetical protein HY908_02025 [Myxococcales bacterium]|nr:hypothetical protein [Myxococcales bacterium]